MEDKTFPPPPPTPDVKSRRERIAYSDWTADLRQELVEIERVINETNALMGLPPADQLASAFSMEYKRFQNLPSPPSQEPERNWRDVLYNKEHFEEMERILREIDYLVELQEAESRPFRF